MMRSIPINSLSPTRSMSTAANWPTRQFFPPRLRGLRRQRLLHESSAQRVVSSRGRRVPRGLKRKMSNYRLRPRRRTSARRIQFKLFLLRPRPYLNSIGARPDSFQSGCNPLGLNYKSAWLRDWANRDLSEVGTGCR